MKIEHTALFTNDLEKMKSFFETYFGAVSGPLYHNQETGFKSYFISFDEGSRLEIMNAPDLSVNKNFDKVCGLSHIAFSAGNREAVDALTKRLKADGFKVVSGPRSTGDGYYESCVLDPDGNPVEITI